MEQYLRVAGIKEDSVVDGPGLRLVVFVQGCPHVCIGCHNPQTHDFNGGKDMKIKDIVTLTQNNPLLTGVTLSGGEPFCQSEQCAELAHQLKLLGYEIWCYTGFAFEHLSEIAKFNRSVKGLLLTIDVLVDGPYKQEMRDETLLFRGSKNQRLIVLENGKYKCEWTG
ncbi:MAG: anaerobic ribonucleoside-triphosphate reductase activating protein [Clostridiales bacterium]|nr:anaerobic ribonucleoside-triphosphate reductase activating protein [Clostridiales bacterium]